MDRALKVTGAAAMAAVAGVGIVGTTESADAAVVNSGPVNISIPATTAGIYVNIITGVSGTAAATTGWDINPWGASGLGFFSPSAPAGGAYVISAASFVANLPVGAVVDGNAAYGSGSSLAANAVQWNLNSSENYFGFRFINEDGGTLHYGWAQLAIGGTITTRAIVQYAYESDPNTPITIPIPEPASLGLLAMGAVGLLRRRNKAA